MSETEAEQSQVAEAVAVYGYTGLEELREGLERLARKHPWQPCRVVQTTNMDGTPVFEMQTWGPAPDTENNYERWLARCNGEPQPPRPVRWRHGRTVRIDRDWSEEQIAAELSDWAAQLEELQRRQDERGRDDYGAPPGYEGDYDLQDLIYDIRYGR